MPGFMNNDENYNSTSTELDESEHSGEEITFIPENERIRITKYCLKHRCRL